MEVPKMHHVGRVLEKHKELLPPVMQKHQDKIESFSEHCSR